MTARIRVGGQTATYTVTWTYLVPAPQITIETTTEQGEDVRLTLGRFRRRPETTMQPPTAEVEATGTVGANNALGNIYFGHNALTTTTNVQFTGNIGGVDGDLQLGEFDPQTVATLNRLMYFTTNEMRAFTRTPAETEAARKQRAKAMAERAKAHDRAMKLLLSHLDDQQRKQVAKHEWFYVKGQFLTYRIHAGERGAYVYTVKPLGSFCIRPRPDIRDGLIPVPDQALALKLMIESDEAEFLLTGNWTGNREGRTYSLVRMGIDGVPGKSGYTSRFYGQPNQPKDEASTPLLNWNYFGVNGNVTELQRQLYYEEV